MLCTYATLILYPVPIPRAYLPMFYSHPIYTHLHFLLVYLLSARLSVCTTYIYTSMLTSVGTYILIYNTSYIYYTLLWICACPTSACFSFTLSLCKAYLCLYFSLIRSLLSLSHSYLPIMYCTCVLDLLSALCSFVAVPKTRLWTTKRPSRNCTCT